MPVQTKKLCGLWVYLVALAFTSAQLRAGVGPIFQPQTRVGFTVGDQWEPSIAADRYGHVYILIPQYTNATQLTIPGCPTCPSPTMFLVMSNDNGATWVVAPHYRASGIGTNRCADQSRPGGRKDPVRVLAAKQQELDRGCQVNRLRRNLEHGNRKSDQSRNR